MSLVGQTIKNTHIQRHIASGGMAEIYLAYDSLTRLPVVVKVLNPDASQNPSLIKRFRQEAETMRRLSHPFIVRVFDIGAIGTQTYMIMDYAPDGSLQDEIATHHQAGKRLPLSRGLDLMRKVISAIAHLHDQEIVHRDLKPANILLKDPHTPMVTDLGIAGVNAAETLTQVGQVFGTLDYMSPEQGLDASKADARADIYAIGVILFELLSGRLPFNGESALVRLSQKQLTAPIPINTLRPDLDPTLCRIVDTCLQSNPEHRYRSASALAREFDHYIGQTGNKHTHVSNQPATRRRSVQYKPDSQTPSQTGRSANPLPLYAIGGMAVLLIGVIGSLFLFNTEGISPSANGVTNQPTQIISVAGEEVAPADDISSNEAQEARATSTIGASLQPELTTPTLEIDSIQDNDSTADNLIAPTAARPGFPLNLDPGLACPGPHIFGSSSQIEFKWTGPTNAEVDQNGGLFLVVRLGGNEIGWQRITPGLNQSLTPGEWIYFNTPSSFNAINNGDYSWLIEFRAGTDRNAAIISQSGGNCFTILNRGGSSNDLGSERPEPPP